MSDRELLELAAKAAGIDLVYDPIGRPRDCTGLSLEMNIYAAPWWNPLTHDGDALRLAVALHMVLDINTTFTQCDIVKGGDVIHWAREEHEADAYAATRRAITRAAAEIEKEMP